MTALMGLYIQTDAIMKLLLKTIAYASCIAINLSLCQCSNEKAEDIVLPEIPEEEEEEENNTDLFSKQMVFVEGGTFQMGQTYVSEPTSRVESNTPDDDSPHPDELPAHEVTVSDFYISKYEVTQEQWIAVMGNNPSYFEGENLPVESVSWENVQEFLKQLNLQTGESYRLPTEAEWEYAARGGKYTKGFRYSGSNTVGNVAWYAENSPGMICAVGQKESNELGLYDMSGNAFEWVNDWYGAYTSDKQTNPQGPSKGKYHVLRGGSWKHSSNGCRVSFRTQIPTYHLNKCGFRIAKDKGVKQ